MPARYLIRFDDIAPGMNWRVWDEVERLLIARAVKPILAVVPDNRDPKLDVGARVGDFWARVRAWQSRGWTIGLHGYQHQYETAAAGLIGLNRYSEFAGLPREVQEQKLRAGLAIFAAEGVRADAWIAPAHSFDETTLDILSALALRRISDGFFLDAHRDRRGFVWIPQQLWRFRHRRSGTWTVCYHINGWGDADLARFASDLEAFAPRITDFETIAAGVSRERSAFDAAFAALYRRYLLALRRVSKFRSSTRTRHQTSAADKT